jgi:hypothetical protein
MNNIEETLWNYIDGNCPADEQKAISLLIASDEAYRLKYQELLSLNQQFAAMELDEPSMAFTYNIMETIRTENAQAPLKAAINKRIIAGIAAFFVFTIAILVIYTMANVNWSIGNISLNINPSALKVPAGLKLPEVKSYLSGPVIHAFLFFDVVLGLFLFDTYLRKRNFSKPV